ncbi:hypothetical protein MUK42_27863 [Musa troglodytarum]|uniref:Uncharacterized protein n=1 Tax=Musa troglodytarum TaxID=320322 RepID=A0A9E7F9B8_9LILI|nr:hypothetical protein MUK42_27863 [Musa troglodytarum]
MAGHGALRRPPAASSAPHQSFTSRVLLLLTVLPLALASFAFVLQWRGGIDDLTSRWPAADAHRFPVMDRNNNSHLGSSAPDCADILDRSSSPSFPYYRGWNFNLGKDLKPKERLQNLIFLLSLKPYPRIWNETWLAAFFYKPCNYELFVKQSLNMEMAIVMAQESTIERDDIKDPFSEAIVQSLRESGVFSSAIASAQASSKQKSTSPIENLQNRSSVILDPTDSISKRGRIGGKKIKSQATARKIMEIVGGVESAMPPMSPPGLDDFSMEMKINDLRNATTVGL